MTNRGSIVLVALMTILLGAAFRFANLGPKYYWEDEAYTSLMVAGLSEQDLNEILRTNSGVPKSIEFIHQALDPAHKPTSTVNTLWNNDPHHLPTFFVAARLWAEQFGANPVSIRLFAVLMSLLLLPSLWLLLAELFPSLNQPVMIIALFSVSPYFMLYGQQAREYGMWGTTIVFLNYTFLRAIRLANARGWALFSFALALSVLTHVFSVFVWIGLGAWILVNRQSRATLSKFFISSIAALIVVGPWLWNIFEKREYVMKVNAWQNWPGPSLWQEFVLNLARLFWDAGYLSLEIPPWSDPFFSVPSALVIAITVFGIWQFWHYSDRRARSFLACLGLPVFVGLAILDLVKGGRRITLFRYLMPSCISLMMMVGIGLTLAIQSQNRRLAQTLTSTTFVLLIGVAAYSSGLFLNASSWWSEYPIEMSKAAPDFKNLPASLPIVAVLNPHSAHLVSLAYSLESSRTFIAYSTQEELLHSRINDAFLLFSSSPELLTQLKERFEINPVVDKWLVRLTPR